MNIFVTSSCPVRCARTLDNKRVVKMVLESAQMLCTALNEKGVITPYKSAHVKHPCTIWAGVNKANWLWLFMHASALSNEYTRRYHKIHKSQAVLDTIRDEVHVLPDGALTPFPNCTQNKEHDISHKDEPNVHKAYRLYLRDRWDKDKAKPKWSVK